jgi:hypothetical protein
VQLSRRRRGIAVAGLGVVAATAAISVAGTGSALASGLVGSVQCGRASVAYSLDGGSTWATNGWINGSAPARITVRLNGDVEQGCTYPVSLASYSAQGPTWQASGEQAFLGWDTAILNSTQQQATLDVSAHLPSCFGQIDLYGNATAYNGITGALPHYPDSWTPTDLIAAWNGSAPCTKASSLPAPLPSPSASPSPSPSPKHSASLSASDTKPRSAPVRTEAPVGSPQVPPASRTPVGQMPAGSLAHTGSNSTLTAALAASGAALTALGAGALVLVRRRRGTAQR